MYVYSLRMIMQPCVQFSVKCLPITYTVHVLLCTVVIAQQMSGAAMYELVSLE